MNDLKKDKFKVDEIEAISFDENGQENGTWKGFSVVKIDDEANYNFDCRDKSNADQLCDFLNNECIIDDDLAIDAFVMDNCIEWGNHINRLSNLENKLGLLKEEYDSKEFNIVYMSDIDFKGLYGSTSEKVRQKHVSKELKELQEEIDDIEFQIRYIKRRISFLKAVVAAKTALIGVKEE